MDPAKPNPASDSTPTPAARRRIPMSVPQRKLEVPVVEGFNLHWFVASNVPRALQGGYEFVKEDEVMLNNLGVGWASELSGNSDLGTNISIVGGGVGPDGKSERIYLMKIRLEWYNEDQQLLQNRNSQLLSAIFDKEVIIGSDSLPQSERDMRYVKTALFNRPPRKAKT